VYMLRNIIVIINLLRPFIKRRIA